MIAAVAILVGAVSVGTGRDAGAAPSGAVQASIALSLATPGSVAGPFVATDTNPFVDAGTGTVLLAGSDLTFAPVEIAVPPQWQFNASLVPDSDVSVVINPKTGEAAINGQFTMQLQSTNGNVSCQLGPFAVVATTQAAGAVVYSPASGQATVIDSNPTIPAVSNCGGAGDAINGALSLPLPAPPSQASSAAVTSTGSDPTNLPVLPAISLQLAISPPLQAVSTPTTLKPPVTVKPTPPTTDPPASHDPAASQSSGQSSKASRNTSRTRAGVLRATTAVKKSSQNAQTTPATLGPNGFGTISGAPSTPGAEPTNLPKGNAFASGPLSAASSSRSSSELPFAIIAGAAALAFALWLIGSDLRKGLAPARQQRAFHGTVLKPSRNAARRSSTSAKLG